MKRVALYVRVSTQEQKKYGLSVDSQIDALRKYCKENNLIEVGLYNDAGISARKRYTKRPALLSLLDDCRQGKIDTILFTKLDRWFRSVGDYYEVQNVLDANNVAWKTIWEDYETETSSGQFKVNIMLAVAQSEADRTSERIKAVNEFRREKGEYLGGNAPIGYIKENRRLKKDVKIEKGLTEFFNAYIDYKPLEECVSIANRHGVFFSRNTAYRILNSDFYYLSDEPYITEEMHNAIRIRVSKNTTRKPIGFERQYLFQGICRCGYCGKKMSASARKRYSQKRGDYIQKIYQCHNYQDGFTENSHKCESGTSINEEILEEYLLEKLDALIGEYNLSVSAKINEDAIIDAESKIKALNSRLTRLQTMYEMGDIELKEYKQKRDSIKGEIEKTKPRTEKPKLIELPKNWKDVYSELSFENKSIFWHRNIRQINIRRMKEIEILFL